ncbi:lysine-specific demethylase 4C isoform X4 [Chelonia mydas]|uniref:lysine-specific demethylase 4C isoform X4 n=1 Tax=Chelonia mydas TaxID=8469 RepID=UPI000FFC2176|nr:lysine-specific demethylase 4C isoform X4 [Chelonia mydas]XP_043403653.1 lysine-specific demethylase 4C isoform X4 [Chelonia mydas]XP_043403654.1 lysine-specific demethylase 4C isoform X4 [Chelonia mydas]
MAAVVSDSPPNPSCKIMTFRPSMDEFREFNKYLAYMESKGAHRAGLAKDIDEWNIAHLNTILDVVGEDCGISIEGVNTPYLYFGMWKTTFAWHTEDMDLYSINYLHFGEPKSWYAIPPEHGKRLERLAQGFFPSSSQGCDAFLRHKMTLISPSILKKYGIPFDKITQEAGEFMITFPYGYHAGFNHGFNCAESTNFATIRWIDYGKVAKLCTCRNDMVTISMDIFVRKFQPDRYQLWKQGKDLYTIDHLKPTPETTPEVKAWLQRRRKTKKPPKCFQHTRSRSKKLKTPEDERESAMIVGAEIIATEAATDGFKVNEKPEEKVKLVNSEVPSGEEKNISRMQLDQHLLDNIEVSGNICSNSLFSPTPIMQKIKTEDEDKEDSSIASFTPKDSTLPRPTSIICVNEEDDSLKSQNQAFRVESCQKSPGYASFESECLEKGETNSVSTEDDVSDLESSESSESGLEPGEIPALAEIERKKTCKSWRHPLSKPPARSPMTLVKQQAVSDEELLEIPLIEEEVQETESWAKPLVHLWQKRAHNFIAEKEYNAAAAKMEPHCAICTLLMPYYKPDNHNEENYTCWETKSDETFTAGEKTKPLIPEMCFIYSEENTENYPSNAFIEEDGTSLLISCAKCCVQVHASCYGVPSHEVHDGWLCSRCKKGAWTAECCLCNLRGGALKQTTDKKWAHVMCAIAIPEVRFGNVTERTPVDTSRIPLQRLKLKCIFCRQRMKKFSGACIQCSYGRCPASFHVTCAHAAGVLMEPDDWPYVVYITCFRHKINQNVRTKACEKAITVGQTVITKHRNTRYYSCRVIGVTSQVFYEVMFDDGSFSRDTFPEDIVSRDCRKLGPPAEGEVVQVKWPDGKLYGAKYLGANVAHMYQVEFEDGSQIAMKREEIYTLDEELPKRVKARFSTASDMRFEDTFYGADIIQGEKKRQRVLSSRFKNEYVDDPGYRTFLKSSFQKKCQKGL